METLAQETLGRDGSQLEARERQRLLSRLLSRLAHEIRNPLGSLDIHVQLLEEDIAQVQPQVAAKIGDRIGVIRTELHRLDGIVRRFLSLAGPSEINPQPVDLRQIVEHACQLLGPEAAERGIVLVANVPPSLPELTADPGQLTQALVNLVINGLQAVDRRGRVEIVVAVEPAVPAICLEVRDSGPGIDPEKRLAIFEPFFTTKPEGSGLGLWIVQQIATAHGGFVCAGSRPGGGAAVSMQLPLRPRPAVV